MQQLGIFLKDPQPCHVKTRLGQAVGMQEAALMYRAFCGDLVATVATLESVEPWIFYAPEGAFESCRAVVEDAAPDRAWRWQAQQGEDLGARMQAALASMLRQGSPALLVGTDLPTLTRDRVRAAFVALERAPVVFGPAVDGGYYLIGATEVVAELFTDMAWSTSTVLRDSLERLRHLGLSYALLPTERDVDTFDDLQELACRLLVADPEIAPRTRRAWRGLRL